MFISKRKLARKRKIERLVALLIVKEFIFALLAAASVMLLILELTDRSIRQHSPVFEYIEIIIAGLFLADVIHLYHYSKDKRRFFRKNWFLVLACIPIFTPWAEALRGLRLLAIIRIFQVEEHILLAERIIKKDNLLTKIRYIMARS